MTAWGVASLLCSLLLLTTAERSVHIISQYNQFVTSSTLNWLPHTHYHESKDFVIGAYEYAPDGLANDAGIMTDTEQRTAIYVCRAEHNGISVAGGQKKGDKTCAVTMTGSVKYHDRYDLLENIEGAARLVWRDWDKYHEPPQGTVGTMTTDKMYVARHALNIYQDDETTTRQTHYIGTLSLQDSFGKISYVKGGDETASAETGQILVEIEPTSYELDAVKLNNAKTKTLKRIPRILGEATIRNEQSETANMAEAFTYTYVSTLYWGQGHAILKGLNTSITLQNKTKLADIKWGIPQSDNVTDVRTISVNLQPGTAVNVTLKGNYSETETPYSGKLISHYDGETKHRSINGIVHEEKLIDVVAELSPIYFLSNFSLVPTTEAPKTTEATTTTTTTTTSPPIPIKNEPAYEVDAPASEESSGVDDNSIDQENKPENVNMQRDDDGGPKSMQNKAEGADSGVQGLHCKASALLMILGVIVQRIT